MKVLSGKWNDNISWEFFLDEQMPDPSLCKVVYCLAIIKETDQLVLTHIERGWEMLGGHIEPGETLDEALVRECMEEGGFRPDVYMLFGHSKVTAKESVSNDHHGGTYPLITYIPHFIAITNAQLSKPTGQEIIENGVFSNGEIAKLKSAHEAIIGIGMERYFKIKGSLV